MNIQQPLEQQLYDIYGMDYVPWWHTTMFYALCCALIGAALGIILYFLIKRYRAYSLSRRPWDSALRELDALAQHHMHAGNSRVFYYTLTDIIKTYLSKRYGYALAGKTDEESIAYLATTDVPLELHHIVSQLLRAGTMSKFASARAAHDQMKEHIALSRDLIKRTISQRTR
ncbi:MAG: DUF4381 family protein [Candidatus Babeliales bacterium]